MRLVERHIIKDNQFKDLCIKAKNLYNKSLYYWRQSIFKNIQYFSEYELINLMREFEDYDFKALPSHTSQQIIRNLFFNIKGWKNSIKDFNINPKKYKIKPKLPKYKKELSELYFTNFQVKLKNGYIHFPKKLNIAPVKTKIKNNLNQCRLIPKNDHFILEFIYTIPNIEEKEYNNICMGIDLGINNLATCIINTGESFIINGKPLKSINQNYNKQKSYLQKKLPKNIFNSKKLNKITLNRCNKVQNYIHHATSAILKKCELLNITKIVIGYNKEWKQNINLGTKTNQSFTLIPFTSFIEKIKYKAEMRGIKVIMIEESYTSKCSALDLEPIKKHDNYLGKRIKRGLFQTANKTLINADCNGALNILRKVIEKVEITDSIVSALVAPKKLVLFTKTLNHLK